MASSISEIRDRMRLVCEQFWGRYLEIDANDPIQVLWKQKQKIMSSVVNALNYWWSIIARITKNKTEPQFRKIAREVIT